jgi:hypothetical protein
MTALLASVVRGCAVLGLLRNASASENARVAVGQRESWHVLVHEGRLNLLIMPPTSLLFCGPQVQNVCRPTAGSVQQPLEWSNARTEPNGAGRYGAQSAVPRRRRERRHAVLCEWTVGWCAGALRYVMAAAVKHFWPSCAHWSVLPRSIRVMRPDVLQQHFGWAECDQGFRFRRGRWGCSIPRQFAFGCRARSA